LKNKKNIFEKIKNGNMIFEKLKKYFEKIKNKKIEI